MSTSKFDELMKFIDNESSTYSAEDSKYEYSNQRSNNDIRPEPSLLTEKSYIWDEDVNSEHKSISYNNYNSNQLSSRKSSVASHDISNLRKSSNSSISIQAGGTNAREMIKEIENKIKIMKDNIKKKSKEIQEYHEELLRLTNAMEKRQNKFKLIHDGKIQDFRKEQSEVLDQQNKIINKLNSDIKDLSSKYNALSDRQEQLMNNKLATIDKAKKGMQM